MNIIEEKKAYCRAGTKNHTGHAGKNRRQKGISVEAGGRNQNLWKKTTRRSPGVA